MELKFRWDEAKAKTNLTDHRVSFPASARIFQNEILERIDDREDYGEVRFVALGRADAEILRVVYTRPERGLIRIISAQKASKHERDSYYRSVLG